MLILPLLASGLFLIISHSLFAMDLAIQPSGLTASQLVTVDASTLQFLRASTMAYLQLQNLGAANQLQAVTQNAVQPSSTPVIIHFAPQIAPHIDSRPNIAISPQIYSASAGGDANSESTGKGGVGTGNGTGGAAQANHEQRNKHGAAGDGNGGVLLSANNSSWHSFCKEHQKKLALSCVLGCYTYLGYCLIRTHRVIKNKRSWCNWCKEKSNEQLLSMPHERLTDSLIFEIAHRYSNTAHPNDSARPFKLFFKKIDHERALYKRYLSIASWIKRLHLTILFPLNESRIKQTKKALKRVQLLRRIAGSHIAEQNYLAIKRSRCAYNGLLFDPAWLAGLRQKQVPQAS